MATECPPPSRHEQLLYVAGLFDGEGSISISTQKDKRVGRLKISLFSTTPALLEAMTEAFGGAVYDCTRRANRKQIWAWVVSGCLATEVAAELWPYLREPSKRARAMIAAERLGPLLGNYHPSDDQREVRQAAESALLAA